MKKVKLFQFAVLSAVLCVVLFFACSNEFPEIDFASKVSSSSVETYNDLSSSSGEEQSSSSAEVSSSSGEALSSSSVETDNNPSSSSGGEALSSSSMKAGNSSSSSNIVLSSSSEEILSSSSKEASSSSAVSISSSSEPSSSSAEPSSSSVAPSSSSAAPSSQSSEGFCTNFKEGTEKYHYGEKKKQFCDKRDGKEYVYVEMGTQTWMAENLNYEASGSKCYDDDSGGDSQGNCAKYGRLYDWATAMSINISYNENTYNDNVPTEYHQGICPDSWHLPSRAEWEDMINYIGGKAEGKKLKAESMWDRNGTDDYGFSALPGGFYNPDLIESVSDIHFWNVGSWSYWWSTGERDNNNNNYQKHAYRVLLVGMLNSDNDDVSGGGGIKSYLVSVRCLRNNE